MNSTFRKAEIENFLMLTDHKYAASQWDVDIKSETPTWLETSNWFQRYFADSNVGQYMFRLCETNCFQYIDDLVINY
jgi:hypothetical protein